MAEAGVDVTAFRDFLRAMDAFHTEVVRKLKDEIRTGAGLVAQETRRRILAVHGDGRMARSVRVGVSASGSARVRVTATDPRTGYRYPNRVHFDTSRKHSDFLYGAVEAKRGEVERGFEAALEEAINHVLTS